MPAIHSMSIDKSRNSRMSSSVGGLKRDAVLMKAGDSRKVPNFQLWCKEDIHATVLMGCTSIARLTLLSGERSMAANRGTAIRQPEVGSMSHTPATRQKVLVADDDHTTRHAISQMLRDANYAVTAAEDGIDALRKVQQTEFDLVFLDIWMPGMSGLEVLACIRAGRSQPKVIIMT